MDCNYIIHFPRLLSNSPFWNHEFGISWSFLLDSCYLGLKPWYFDGTRHLPNCHFRFDYATFGWCKNYWNWRYTKRTVRLRKRNNHNVFWFMNNDSWLKYLVLYSLVPRNFSVWLWLLAKPSFMYWLVCMVIQLKWELVSVVWSLSNFSLLDSLFCFLTNSFPRYDSFYYTIDSYSIDHHEPEITFIAGLRSWIWYFSFHCHEYLWNYRLESILPNYSQCWSWCWIRRCHRCPLPPFGHQEW